MRWLLSLFRRKHIETQLQKELRFHIDQQTDDYIAAGMAPGEARRRARIELGAPEAIKEECREAHGLQTLESILQDLRYAIRFLRKSPAFAAAAVLSLALGIGANTAIFSVMNTLLFKPLAVRNPEQLVSLARSDSRNWGRWPYGLVDRWRTGISGFSSIAAVDTAERYNVAVNGQVDDSKVRIALVSGNYFATLGVRTILGRAIAPDDDQPGKGRPVAVISYGYWKRRFAGAPGVLDQTVALNGIGYNILGVAEEGFSGDWIGQPTDLWIPLAMQAQAIPERLAAMDDPWGRRTLLRVIARLKPGAPAAQAAAAATVLNQQFQQDRARQTGEGINPRVPQTVQLLPAALGYSPERGAFSQPVVILMVVVGLVLLIACANIANLLLARSAARRREIAVRLSLGAGRARVVRQLLSESLLLALLGGGAGLLVAAWGAGILLKMVAHGFQPVYLSVQTDARTLGFTLALSALTGVLFGIAPALRSSKVPIIEALKGESAGAARFGLSKALMVAQVALSLTLLIGAGLFVRTLHNLKSQDLGYDRRHLLLVWTAPGQTGRRGAPLAHLYSEVRARIEALPGIRSATQAGSALLNPTNFWLSGTEAIRVQGQASRAGGHWSLLLAAPKLFETLGVPLVAGRDFSERDTKAPPGSVAIINSALAEFYFPNRNPLGQHIGMFTGSRYPTEIIGVVNNSKSVSPRDRNLGMIYIPILDGDIGGDLCLAVRTAGDPQSAASMIRQSLHELDPGLPVLRILTIEQQLDEALARERLIATLAGFFSALALLLASLGLYGLLAYMAQRRSREIGIRIALGATRGKVLSLIFRDSMALVVTGVAFGVAAAAVLTRYVSSWLYDVSPADPWTIAACVSLLLAVAALATILPARRAAQADPLLTLRHE